MQNDARKRQPVVGIPRPPRPSEVGTALRAAGRKDDPRLVNQRRSRFARGRKDVWRVWEKWNHGRSKLLLGYVRGPSSGVGSIARAEWPDKVGKMELELIPSS